MTRLYLPETDAVPTILSRAQAVSDVGENFKEQLEALKDAVDYGTHLLLRCLGETKGQLKDTVVLSVLTKQQLMLGDAAQVVLTAGCVNPAMLFARALFEASVYAEWILREKGQRRARAYYTWYARRCLENARKIIKGTPENRALKKLLREGRVPRFLEPQAQELARQAEQDALDYLSKSHSRRWNMRFEALKKRQSRKHEPNWYEVLRWGKARNVNVGTIAKRLGRELEYTFIYGYGSDVMHSRLPPDHVKVLSGGHKVGIRQIRELTNMPLAIQLILGVLVSTYHRLLTHYRPAELDQLRKDYVARWQKSIKQQIRVNQEYDFSRAFSKPASWTPQD